MTERVRSLFRNLLTKRQVERALDDEMRACLEILIDQKIAQGMSVTEARRASLIELGGVEQVKERVRWSRSGALIDGLRQDLGYALRRLAREPGFTASAVVILALAPLTHLPLPLQWLSNLVPARWFLTIVRGIMLKGAGLATLWQETLILMGMTLFLLVQGSRRLAIRLG